MNKILLNKKSYFYRFNIKTSIQFKQMTNKPIGKMDSEDDEELMIYLYCAIQNGNNPDFDMNFDDFIDFVSEDEKNEKEIMTLFMKKAIEDSEKQAEIVKRVDKDLKDKKKSKKK